LYATDHFFSFLKGLPSRRDSVPAFKCIGRKKVSRTLLSASFKEAGDDVSPRIAEKLKEKMNLKMKSGQA
jgi:hypothetical protein